jgi:hypothetical protein
MRLHFDKSETSIRLHSAFQDSSKIHKKRSEIVLASVRGEVATVAGGLSRWRLSNDLLVGLHAVGGKWWMIELRGRHAHLHHCLLLRKGWLAFLICPVAANLACAQPFSIHGSDGFVCVFSLAVGNKSIASGATSLHIPHDASFGDFSENGKCSGQCFIVDFVGQVANKDVEMVRSILLVRIVWMICPVDSNFLFQLVDVDEHQTATPTLPKTFRPLSVDMAFSAAAGSSYSTKP